MAGTCKAVGRDWEPSIIFKFIPPVTNFMRLSSAF